VPAPIGRGFEVHQVEPDPAPRPGPGQTGTRPRPLPTEPAIFTQGATAAPIGKTASRQGLEPGALGGAGRVSAPIGRRFDVHRMKPDRRQGQGQGPAVAGSAGPSPARAWKVARALSPAPWVEPDGCRRPSAGLRGAPGEAGPAPRPGASRGRIGRTFTRAGLEGRQGLEPGADRQGFEVHQVEPEPARRPRQTGTRARPLPTEPAIFTQGATAAPIGKTASRQDLQSPGP